jgi:hypothetical protein
MLPTAELNNSCMTCSSVQERWKGVVEADDVAFVGRGRCRWRYGKLKKMAYGADMPAPAGGCCLYFLSHRSTVVLRYLPFANCRSFPS